MNEREALKLALEALDCICSPLHVREITKVGNAMKAIKEALAQPDQEPVAWQVKYRDDEGIPQIAWFPHPVHSKSPLAKRPYTEEPLYTTPSQREWVGLTDEERDHFEGLHLYAARNQVEAWIEGVPAFIDAIEAKLREKNTYTSPPQRKPLPPQSPCEMTQAEGKMFKLGWLECEAAHGIKGE